jgi:hypothetical protein
LTLTYVCLERRIAFIHVPRAGGTSILEALRAQGGGLPLEPHLRARDLRDRLGVETWDTLHSIAVVREPIDWFASLCRYIRSRPLHRLFVAAATSDHTEFARLAAYVAKVGNRQIDFLCAPCGEPLVRHVLRFERLAEEWAELAQRLPLPSEIPHLNAVIDASGPLDEDSRRVVASVLAEDAIRLGAAGAEESRSAVGDAWAQIAAFGAGWFDDIDACREMAGILHGLGEFDAAAFCATRARDAATLARIPQRLDVRTPHPDVLRAFLDRIVSGTAAAPYISAATPS